MGKTYTTEDLKIGKIECETTGNWVEAAPYSKNGSFNINYSDILTKLIQEAGRWCEHYASDLFITWSSLEKS